MSDKMREAIEDLKNLMRHYRPGASMHQRLDKIKLTMESALSQQPESEAVDDWLVYCLEYIGAGDPDDIECDDYELYAETDEGQSGTITVSISETCRKAATALQGPQPSAQVPEGWRTALENLLAYAWRQICMHEDTHRAGSIWEICDQCGARWADDEGGRPDFATPPEIEAAEELLAAPSIAEKDQ